MSQHITHGTCSLCGGAVTTPFVWMSTIPPTPTCSSCGAQPANAHGPVIPMVPARRQQVRIHSGTDASGQMTEWLVRANETFAATHTLTFQGLGRVIRDSLSSNPS